jgi:hypothetical protein
MTDDAAEGDVRGLHFTTEKGRIMPFAYPLRSAIDRGPRRTGFGQFETFDTDSGIADNLRSQLLQFAERSNDDRRH